jgi:hypothetical protein
VATDPDQNRSILTADTAGWPQIRSNDHYLRQSA